MAKKALKIDGIIGSQLRDSQGEMLSVDGADIDALTSGNGRINDNHGKGFFNSVGRVTQAKKIYSEDDCDNERHKYFWEKVKSPFIYMAGKLYDDEDHPNARAAAAILRNIHKEDSPLQLKASVEGGILKRGEKDKTLLAQTKIHSVALTFTPANKATLIEPVSLSKSSAPEDEALIKSVMHLARENVPNFIDISNALKMQGIEEKVLKIHDLSKALTAGYGGAGSPSSKIQGAVLQTEVLPNGRKDFKRLTCDDCGFDQIMAKNQLRCRKCGISFSFEKAYAAIVKSK